MAPIINTREVVRHLRQKHEQTETAVANASAAANADLHTLGVALYQTLAGESFSNNIPASSLEQNNDNANDGGERSQKRERHLGRQNDLPALRDLGHPIGLSIFVQSLIDATDEDAPERFASIGDVEDDLERMIVMPDKYVFGQPSLPSSSSTTAAGQMQIATTLYGRQVQQSQLMQAFQGVIVTGEESRGLALVSGPSGSGKVCMFNFIIRLTRYQCFPFQ